MPGVLPSATRVETGGLDHPHMAWSGVENDSPMALAFQLQIKDGFDLAAAFLCQEPLTFVLVQGSAQ